jgi:hypothetical protein
MSNSCLTSFVLSDHLFLRFSSGLGLQLIVGKISSGGWSRALQRGIAVVRACLWGTISFTYEYISINM